MGEQRQSWSVEEKVAAVLAVLSERQSVAGVARQRGSTKTRCIAGKNAFWKAVGKD